MKNKMLTLDKTLEEIRKFNIYKKQCEYLKTFTSYNKISNTDIPIDVCYSYHRRLYKDKCKIGNCPSFNKECIKKEVE